MMADALVLGTVAAAAQVELAVTNVVAQQRINSTLVDVTYDLETIDALPAAVSLWLSTDAGATISHHCQAVSGSVGEGVLPGTGLSIVWDAGAELQDLNSASCRLRVTAYARENLDGFVLVPPGSFTMGSPPDESGRYEDEAQHPVT